MSENKSALKGGASGTTLLQIAFIVLKLCGVIDWKWIWVLAPTWIAIILVIVIVLIVLKIANMGGY